MGRADGGRLIHDVDIVLNLERIIVGHRTDVSLST